VTQTRVDRTAARTPGTADVVREMVRPTIRAMSWKPLAGATAVAVAVVFWLTRNQCPEPCVSVDDQILTLRIGMLLLAIGAAFVLDDPTDDTTAHLPVTRALRRGLRVALTLPAVVLGWQLLMVVARRSSVDHVPFPTGALTWELAAILAAGFALAVLAAPFAPDRMGGVAAGPALVAGFALAFALPHRFAVFSGGPLEPRWVGAHDVWRWVFLAGVAAFAWAGRDPGGRYLPRRSA
jgi:hypothetical protein